MVMSWFRPRLARRLSNAESHGRRRFRPAVEQLEGRACPAFGPTTLVGPPSVPPANLPAHVINGVSLVTTDDAIIISPGSFGTINVRHLRGQFHMEAGTATPDAGTTGQLIANYNLLVRPGLRLDVYAGDGNDIVLNHTGVPCRVFGGDGNDVIYGGGANDELFGGMADDYINGRGGDDTLYGDIWLSGWGDVAAYGDDYLVGEAGSDLLYGERGVDTLIGGFGGLDHDGTTDYLDGNSWFNGTQWTNWDGMRDYYCVEWHRAGVLLDVLLTHDYWDVDDECW
jgi:hypothetical protein